MWLGGTLLILPEVRCSFGGIYIYLKPCCFFQKAAPFGISPLSYLFVATINLQICGLRRPLSELLPDSLYPQSSTQLFFFASGVKMPANVGLLFTRIDTRGQISFLEGLLRVICRLYLGG